MTQRNTIFRDETNDPGSSTDLFLQPIFDVVDHIRALGGEDEFARPLSIAGKIAVELNTAASYYGMVGKVYAISHITTDSEKSSEVNDETQTDVYTLMQSAYADAFNAKEIGTFKQLNNKQGHFSFNFKIPKKLRDMLSNKIEDPDFNVSLDIVLVLKTTQSLLATGEYIRFSAMIDIDYVLGRRKLTDLVI